MREPNHCEKRATLHEEVRTVLKELEAILAAQLSAFLAENSAEYMRLDEQLELTIGKKERAIGAFREHIREHGCRPQAAPPN